MKRFALVMLVLLMATSVSLAWGHHRRGRRGGCGYTSSCCPAPASYGYGGGCTGSYGGCTGSYGGCTGASACDCGVAVSYGCTGGTAGWASPMPGQPALYAPAGSDVAPYQYQYGTPRRPEAIRPPAMPRTLPPAPAPARPSVP